MASRNLSWILVGLGIHTSLSLSKMGGREGTNVKEEEAGI